MGWLEVQEAIRDAVALALELPDFVGADGLTTIPRVEWENKSTAARWCDGPWCDLRMGTVRPLHTVETRLTFNEEATPEDSTIDRTVGQTVHFTVTVKVGVPSQDPGEESVGHLAGKLRLRLMREDAQALLQAANVAVVHRHPTNDASYEDENTRMWSAAWTDIVFSTIETDIETGLPYINEAASATDNTIDNVDGTDILLTFDTATV